MRAGVFGPERADCGASIVAVPRQRNRRGENWHIKEGEIPEDWSNNKKRQKDTDARWTRKNGQNQYGYKNHIDVDVKHKLIRSYEVSPASVHESQVFESLLDQDNSSREVRADSAYRSEVKLAELKKRQYREHLQRKGSRHKKLTDREVRGNRTRSRIRSRVEHVFGVQAKRAGTLLLRGIGLLRVAVKVGLRNLAYNIDRFCVLLRACIKGGQKLWRSMDAAWFPYKGIKWPAICRVLIQ